ncbi:hypothetical protein [Lachnotalea sp. AF33-28]|uniref:hypothetical protein n=1 Tax=Lachnotalea sp. AF33-28 TaxID=2292046 RepID=UPI000E4C73A4|nr:hypothetical protein [Lachnotalea sp. AF33-28]RHP30254.1 hypothetical protein DWZ56_19305 [Lachnotalea sp. AF33-28]
MKKIKAVVAVLLCFVMLLSMAGCGTKEKDAGGSTTTVEKPKNEEDKMKAYDPAITMTFNKSEVVTAYPEGMDAQNNALYQMWEDIMGIKVENSILCPSSSMTEKMQLAIGSNEIPDFGIVDATMMATLIKNDMVEDMTDVYNDWATDNLKTVTGQSDNALFAPVTRDGRYMAIPVANTLGDSYPIMWMRSDWLAALGLEEPKTMDEALDIAMKFATDDPDGNGQKDTYGLYLDKDLNGLDHIMSAYEVYSKDEYWVKKDDGSFMAGCTDEKAKVPLAKLAELYAAGAIDPEFAVKDTTKEEELIAAGKIGIYIGYFFNPLGVMKDCVKNVEGADWVAVKMPPAEGVASYKPGVALNVYGYMYAKKGIEHPEAVVKMMNQVCDGFAAPDLAKEPTEFYTKFNELALDDAIRTAGPNNLMPFQMQSNINWGEKFTAAVEAGEEHVEGKDADYQNVISTELPEEMSWAWKKVYLEGYLAIDFSNVRYSDYAGAPTDTAVKTQSLLNKQKLTDYISIIMGDQPVDYFDTFVETFNSIGGSKVAEEIKAAAE